MLLFIIPLLLHLSMASTDVASCSCGFLDSKTGSIWTEAIITYGNESSTLPADSLVAEEFQHAYEKNWNARYRAGASPRNIGNNESSAPGWDGNAWTLSIDRPTKNHAVVGASIRSLRRDILYGTFESVLSPPKAGSGGTVLAMRLDYNESQTLNLNVMNADAPKDAWTSFMIYGDWRGERSKGVNFTDFGNSSYNFPTSPWGFVPYRIDWTDKKADFFIGNTLARSIQSHESPKEWPTTPSTLYIRHSSIGDAYTSEGPPPNGSYAHLGRIRAFFNSSMMTVAEHASFDARCRGLQASDNAPAANSSSTSRQCLVSDISLRGITSYSTTATTQFKQRPIDYTRRWPAILIASTCIAISTILLLHALFKRAPWAKKKTEASTEATVDSARASKEYYVTPSMIFSERDGLALAAQFPGSGTPGAVTPGTQTPGHRSLRYSDFTPAWSEVEGAYSTRSVSSTSLAAPARPRPESGSLHIPPLPVGLSIQQRSRCEDITAILTAEDSNQPSDNVRGSLDISPVEPNRQVSAFVELIDEEKEPEVTVKEINVPSAAAASAKPAITPPKQRVDYLAGLVALASVLVTLIHFCLTFLPATEIPYTHTHYRSEIWALKIVTPYLLTFSWIGPFFTSSTRFLVMTYIKSGNLKGIAEKTVGRTPRLIIPCAAIAALEYFCMQVGAIGWLEYLPSVTWSTWPYTSNYVTFGHFISEVIELMYIIPNAVPQITFNYCIGVLWTIPVQLQNSWTCLLAVIVIREIKTPWKRMGYYAFCILNNWYAMSWGSFFWVGLLIADLDITYKWKTWLYARPFVYYPFLTFITLLAVGSPSIDLVGQWTTINFNTLEFGVHPHQRTGHLIRETVDYGYPPYYIPRLTALTFSIGFHLLVELSPLVQKFFSNRILMWLFPHILTLYLIHGLVFWSLGAVICVKLAAHGVPYWANMLVVATCSYTVIFGCLPLLTPIIETLGKSITQTIWRDASEKPARRRKSLFPFSPDLLKDGEKNDTEVLIVTVDVEKNKAEEDR